MQVYYFSEDLEQYPPLFEGEGEDFSDDEDISKLDIYTD